MSVINVRLASARGISVQAPQKQTSPTRITVIQQIAIPAPFSLAVFKSFLANFARAEAGSPRGTQVAVGYFDRQLLLSDKVGEYRWVAN